MRGRGGERGRGERGVALVEFALLLPFLALLVFGTVDFGRAYQLQNRLRNAAREGADFAQYFPGKVTAGAGCVDPDTIAARALGENAGTANGFTVSVLNKDTNSTVSGCSLSGIAAGTHIEVRVRSTMTLATPFASTFVSNPMPLTGTAQIVVQG